MKVLSVVKNPTIKFGVIWLSYTTRNMLNVADSVLLFRTSLSICKKDLWYKSLRFRINFKTIKSVDAFSEKKKEGTSLWLSPDLLSLMIWLLIITLITSDRLWVCLWFSPSGPVKRSFVSLKVKWAVVKLSFHIRIFSDKQHILYWLHESNVHWIVH